MDIAWADVNANLQTAEQLVAGAERADVYVLPEMFTTGFIGNPEEVAGDEAAALDWMRRTAARLDAAVCGSMAVRNGDRFSNRFFFVKPDGEVAHYDKRHLFAYGGEHGRSLDDSIAHFHEKLLLLKDEMNTGTGRRLAEERHAFLLAFLAEYQKELEEVPQL